MTRTALPDTNVESAQSSANAQSSRAAKTARTSLPDTGDNQSGLMSVVGALFAGAMGLIGLAQRKRR
ncbi:LPXTG cell wall anchor domain-containing protein [Lacticaseibacillus jixiensis]|uniref:LPXTG cell wall anchor domain-containing protein n=1 Tax=Lacticaseibacillus jixiensis TaxID=3231926 RepID=UPI0036F1BFB2